jgi:hypothetical protein
MEYLASLFSTNYIVMQSPLEDLCHLLLNTPLKTLKVTLVA